MFRFLKDFLFEEDLVPVSETRSFNGILSEPIDIEKVGSVDASVDTIRENPAGAAPASPVAETIAPTSEPVSLNLDSAPTGGLMLDINPAKPEDSTPDIPLAGEDVEFGDLTNAVGKPIEVETPDPTPVAEPVQISVSTPEATPAAAPLSTPEPAPVTPFTAEIEHKVEEPAPAEPEPEIEKEPAHTFEAPSSQGLSEESIEEMKEQAMESKASSEKEVADIDAKIEKLQLKKASLQSEIKQIDDTVLPEIEKLAAARRIRLENEAKLKSEAEEEAKRAEEIESNIKKLQELSRLNKVEQGDRMAA